MSMLNAEALEALKIGIIACHLSELPDGWDSETILHYLWDKNDSGTDEQLCDVPDDFVVQEYFEDWYYPTLAEHIETIIQTVEDSL